jgi:hypothetical protein
MHNVSQLVCEKSSFWGGGGFWHHDRGKARRHGGAEFDAKECGESTHHQYKATLNIYEKAEPIGRARCPHVLDVELGTQSRHHGGGVMMLCLSSLFAN